MELRIIYLQIYISCVFIASYLDAKTFSLNDVIAAEQKIQPSENILDKTESTISQGKKTSPLKYRKTFQIKSPSKPKKLKHLQRPRNKRKKFTSKREINENEIINNKYIPLLRNIGLLFDNILSSSSSESYTRKYKYKRNEVSTDDRGAECTCINKNESSDRSPPQKTTSTTPSTTEIENETNAAFITTTQAYTFINDNISGFRRNTNIPLLLTRNTPSFRRNNYRFRERDGSSYNGSFQGLIARNSGDNEYHTNSRETESNTEYYEENSSGNSRDNSSSLGFRGAIRRTGKDTRNSKIYRRTDENEEFILSTNETIKNAPRNVSQHERNVEFEIRRNKTEGSKLLPEFTSRLRKHNDTQKEILSVRVAESNEKSNAFNETSNKRFFVGNGSDTTKNKTICGTDKTLECTSKKSNNPVSKVVMIFDGYSVARDVNGENSRSEKAIHIHS